MTRDSLIQVGRMVQAFYLKQELFRPSN